MRARWLVWWWWWWLLVALQARSLAQTTPTVCHDAPCRCDSFTRLICDCTTDYEEVTLRPDGAYRVPSTATAIIINGCARVYFLQDTAKELRQLRSVELNNVRHAYFKERSLAWSPYPREFELANPGLRISIHNTTINELASHAIKGRIDDIEISASRINVIRPFAFSTLTGVKNIRLTDNVFDNIEIQAFKKFTTVNFVLRGGVIHTLPSRFLSDVEVVNLLRMDGVTVKRVSSLAFLVSAPKTVVIERNTIDVLEGDSFHIASRGPITVRNNTIRVVERGAFLGLSAESDMTSVYGRQELLIDNNTVTTLQPSSFLYNRSSLTLRVDGLNLNASCTCELAEEWKELLSEQGGTLACWYGLDEHYVSLPTYIASRCGAFKQNFWIFIVVGIVFVVFVGVMVAFFVIKRENEKKKKVQIVMPDGKTYRETEFHIVVERAELLTTDL